MRSRIDRLPLPRIAGRALIIAVASGTLLFGCGGSDSKTEAEKAQEAVQEKFGEEGLIEAQIVIRAYDEGRLGTREQVDADMEPFFNPPDSNRVPKPFDANSGKLIPLTQMNDEQIYAFSQWYTSGKPYSILREEISAAITEFRAKKTGKKD